MAGSKIQAIFGKESDPLVLSMQKKLPLDNEPWLNESWTIFKVRFSDEDQASYDPKFVSLGPFHHGQKAVEATEKVKWRYLQDLLRRSPKNSVKKYVEKVRAIESRARKQYSEAVQFEGDALVEMLVVDGCFIIEFLVKWYLDDRKGQTEVINRNLPLLRNDLLLLENQIPFFLLQSLFDCTAIPDLTSNITLTEIALVYLTRDKMKKLPPPAPGDESSQLDVHHLLHLFHSSLRQATYSQEPTTSWLLWMSHKAKGLVVSICSTHKIVIDVSSMLFFTAFKDIFDYIYRRSGTWLPERESSRSSGGLPSATYLRDTGFTFKKKGAARCFLDVTLRGTTIEIPTLSNQEATLSQIQNLVAFEQCYPKCGSHFTCYAMFMGFLIDTAEDVTLLKECGIVGSRMGSDKAVASFFGNLCKGAYLVDDEHYLRNLFMYVTNYYKEKYYKVLIYRWRKKLIPDYFTNAWAVPSMAAAFILLMLTVVQTYYTVISCQPPQ